MFLDFAIEALLVLISWQLGIFCALFDLGDFFL
jgi:hypothetical protein